MFYRFKERDASRFLGAPGDLLYNGTSSLTNLSYLLGLRSGYFTDEAYHLEEYYKWYSTRNKLAYCPDYAGRERISWTSYNKESYNPCYHIRSRLVNKPYRTVYQKWDAESRYYITYFYRSPSPAVYPYDIDDLDANVEDYQATRARAWHNMQPRFEGKISLINFLYELKDFRDIVKYVMGPKRRALNDIRKILNKKRPNLAPKDPSRGIATAILVNNFAIQPLIKDISAMMQQANIIVREAQQMFFESGSEYQKSHYSEELYRNDSRTKTPNTNGYWVANGYLERQIFTATLRYKYDYTMRNTIDAWMKYWGLCGSFEAWWNMIPFSFLVDYFVQIGNSIHAMEHDPKVTLTDYIYGESIKNHFWYGWSTTGDPRHRVLVLDGKVYLKDRGDNLADKLLAGIEGSIYNRELRTPYYGPATPRLKLPSSRQTLNICALLRCLL